MLRLMALPFGRRCQGSAAPNLRKGKVQVLSLVGRFLICFLLVVGRQPYVIFDNPRQLMKTFSDYTFMDGLRYDLVHGLCGAIVFVAIMPLAPYLAVTGPKT